MFILLPRWRERCDNIDESYIDIQAMNSMLWLKLWLIHDHMTHGKRLSMSPRLGKGRCIPVFFSVTMLCVLFLYIIYFSLRRSTSLIWKYLWIAVVPQKVISRPPRFSKGHFLFLVSSFVQVLCICMSYSSTLDYFT